MAFNLFSWNKRPVRDRTTQHWGALADTLQQGGKLPSQATREEALRLYRTLGSVLQLSDPRAPRVRTNLAAATFHPGTDWRWRPGVFSGPVAPTSMVEPETGQKFGGEISVWHDCENKSLVIRQLPNTTDAGLVPFGLRLETLSFMGEYLSLSLDLPDSVLEWLGKSHILRLDMNLQAETAIEVYGRINIAQGPNNEQVLRKLGDTPTDRSAYRTIEFDLAYADLAERPIEKVWLDLIFSTPYMNAINLRDVMLSRYPRSEV